MRLNISFCWDDLKEPPEGQNKEGRMTLDSKQKIMFFFRKNGQSLLLKD
jgi:hypothetical protein